MSTVISVMNWKGGVGKTTFTHNLAAALHLLPRNGEAPPRILLIDLDPQCNLSISCVTAEVYQESVKPQGVALTLHDLMTPFFYEDEPELAIDDYIRFNSVRQSIEREHIHTFPNMDLMLSHQDLIFTDMDIATLGRANFKAGMLHNRDAYKFRFLDHILHYIKRHHRYDYILIDCPPNLNYLTQNALFASDFYLVPTILDTLSTYGIVAITKKVEELNALFAPFSPTYRPTKLLGIVANQVTEYNKEPKQTERNKLVTLMQRFPQQLFSTYLTLGDGIKEASSQGLSVFASTSQNAVKQKDALLKIANELERRIHNEMTTTP